MVVIEHAATLAPSVFALYMLVVGNFLPELLGCRLQSVLKSSMLAKHVTALLLTYFLVVLANPEYADKHFWKSVLATLAIYAWFLCTTRSPLPLALASVICLLVIYHVSIRRQSLISSNGPSSTIQMLNTTQTILTVVVVLMSIVGCGIYMVEKKMEYKEKFNWNTFVIGERSCRNYTPSSAKLI
jgi:hypothetical protein